LSIKPTMSRRAVYTAVSQLVWKLIPIRNERKTGFLLFLNFPPKKIWKWEIDSNEFSLAIFEDGRFLPSPDERRDLSHSWCINNRRLWRRWEGYHVLLTKLSAVCLSYTGPDFYPTCRNRMKKIKQ
jgi:hypothetical protein